MLSRRHRRHAAAGTARTCIATASTDACAAAAARGSPRSPAAARFPRTALYTVVAEPEGTVVGTVDEDFAVESLAGDIMLLGNTSWRIRRVEQRAACCVEDAHGAPPTIPFWRGEAPARTRELSQQVGDVRQTVSDLTPRAVRELDRAQIRRRLPTRCAWLHQPNAASTSRRRASVEYIVTGRAVLGAVPTQDTIIAERFFDEGGGMQLVIHAPFGARINKAWGLALRKRFCRSFNFELQAAATDNGINISLAEQHSFPLADVFQFLQPGDRAAKCSSRPRLPSPIFGTRWRWDAGRALALLRFRGGKKVPLAHPADAVATICWRRCFPTSPRARRTSKATSGFRIIRWSAR